MKDPMTVKAESTRSANGNQQNNTKSSRPQFSISNGNTWQPCEVPVETPSEYGGVGLGFNYWIRNRQILGQDVSDFITDILKGNSQRDFVRKEGFRAKKVVIVMVHGLDAQTLAENMNLLNYLRVCSCVPLRHSVLNGHQWRPNEVENASSLILWPLKEALTLPTILDMGVTRLFEKCCLTFKVRSLFTM